MKIKLYLVVLLLATIVACTKSKESTENPEQEKPAAEIPADTIKKSIPKEVKDKIGDATVTIKYHAPAVRGRTIWGGLVPYGEIWVTGAHKATSFEIDKPFEFGSKRIDAGKYAFFTIPAENNWTIILNKNWDQHLTDEYDEKDDVIRFQVPVEEGLALQNRLYYDIVDYEGSKGGIVIRWEKMVVVVPIHVK